MHRSTLLLVVVAFVAGGLVAGSVNAFPGFSNETGPTDAEVTALEHLGGGCAESVRSFSAGRTAGNEFSHSGLLATEDSDANISASVERVSPAGAEVGVFRVAIDSHSNASAGNDSCSPAVAYRVNVSTSGGSPEGLLPDGSGTVVLWYENGERVGCSASLSGSSGAVCDGDDRRVVHANGSGPFQTDAFPYND